MLPSSLFDDPAEIQDEEIDEDVTYEDDNPTYEGDPIPPDADVEDGDDDEGPRVLRDDDAISDMDTARAIAAQDATGPGIAADAPNPEALQSRYERFGDLRLEYAHWTNPRTISGLEDGKIAELAESIRARTISGAEGEPTIAGLTDPMKVVAIDANGRVDLLVYDGQRRHLATKKTFGKLADDVMVPVIWRFADPVKWTPELAHEIFVEAVHGVGTREGLSAYELSEIAVKLRGANDPRTGKQTTLAAIAKDLNRSESWVSKILGARERATPKLLGQWRSGAITEEQFRDLAVVKDKGEQSAKADEVAAARGRGEGRRAAKEQKLIARKEEAAAKPAKADLPIVAAPAEPKRPKPMHFAAIEDVVSTADKYPPTHDLVRGVILGMRVASGMLDSADLPKPWHQYLNNVASRAARKDGKSKPDAKKKGKSKKK